jgi:hypothetical protein
MNALAGGPRAAHVRRGNMDTVLGKNLSGIRAAASPLPG